MLLKGKVLAPVTEATWRVLLAEPWFCVHMILDLVPALWLLSVCGVVGLESRLGGDGGQVGSKEVARRWDLLRLWGEFEVATLMHKRHKITPSSCTIILSFATVRANRTDNDPNIHWVTKSFWTLDYTHLWFFPKLSPLNILWDGTEHRLHTRFSWPPSVPDLTNCSWLKWTNP